MRPEDRRRIATAALLIAGGNVLSRVLGFVREPVIAALLGATGNTDALEVATRIPQLVHDLVVGGAVAGALIPVFSEMAGDEARLRRTFSSVLATVALALLGVVTVLVVWAEPLVDVAAGGLPPETRELAVTMTRITLPGVLFLGIAAVTTARLYARDRFAFPALSTASLNATLIVFALGLTPLVGPPGVALGYLAGAGMHLAIQIPGLIRDRARLTRPQWRNNPELWRVLRLYAPVAAGLVLAQVLVVVDTNLASRTGEGSLATMRFATRLQQFPLGLVASAIALAFLPALSRAAPSAASLLPGATDYKSALTLAAKTALVLMVPITVLLTVLSTPVIRVVYERGAFDAAATVPVGTALFIYALQLPLTALDQLFIAAFYATRNTVTPVLVGVVGGLVYLVTALALVEPLGVFGLVTANTVQNSFHGLVLGWLLWRRLRGFGEPGVWRFAAKIALSGLVAAGVALAVRELMVQGVEPDGRAGWATLGLAGVAALVAYAAALAALRVREAGQSWRLARRALVRLRGGTPDSPDA